MLAMAVSDTGAPRLIITSLDSAAQPTELRRTGGIASWARSIRIAPDGRAFTYSRALAGSANVSVFWQELPGPDAVARVVAPQGQEPVWGVTARELYFRNDDQIVRATLAMSPEPRIARLDSLFAFPRLPGETLGRGPVGQYDVSRDGQRFVMVKPLSNEHPPVVVLNWLTEVRQRTALAGRK